MSETVRRSRANDDGSVFEFLFDRSRGINGAETRRKDSRVGDVLAVLRSNRKLFGRGAGSVVTHPEVGITDAREPAGTNSMKPPGEY